MILNEENVQLFYCSVHLFSKVSGCVCVCVHVLDLNIPL